jgi:tetratricopeptide (TPR) repeat protein
MEFKSWDGEPCLMLSNSPDEDPYYGIDLTGEVIWRSEEFERKMRIEELMDSEDTESLETVIDELEEAYELSSDKYEKKPIANKLADAHWKLAKEIKKKEEVTDECWSHLNDAYTYYLEILPWYDGKRGAAKVKRLQGKYYLKQEDEESALACFEEIQNLEEEYDVQLLTDADERRLEELG